LFIITPEVRCRWFHFLAGNSLPKHFYLYKARLFLGFQMVKNGKGKEKLLREYYQKYSKLEVEVAKDFEHVSKEADAMLDDN